MSRDILSGFGQDTSQPQRPRARSGGVTEGKDVNHYCPPQGPTNIMESQSPGLHGTNQGNTNRPVAPGGHSGGPGLGGTNHGCCGSQGEY